MNTDEKRKLRRAAAIYREERGTTLVEAARAFGVCPDTVRRGAHELAAERAGVEAPWRAGAHVLADMHARGLDPTTIYAAGCRCPACRAAQAEKYREYAARKRRLKEEAEAAERLERLMAKANEPIRDLHIHGLGTLTVTPDGERIVKAVE